MNTVGNKGGDLKMENMFKANQEQDDIYKTIRSFGKKKCLNHTYLRGE